MPDFEICDERFRACMLPNAPLVVLADGLGWLDGPVWFGDHDCLLFSDLPNDRILRWSEHSGLSLFRRPAGFTNGQTRDHQGRLISCSHRHRCLLRTELDGRITVIADRYQGKRLNSPNQVICAADGSLWFTDALDGIVTDYLGGKQASERPPGVYRLDPKDGSLRLMAADFAGPHGLALSPDQRRLYVAETGVPFAADPGRHIRVFDVADGGLRLENSRVFYTTDAGHADGMAVDQDGNVWCATGEAVHCVAPDGRLIGWIDVGVTVSNIAFGGRNRSRLFICASQWLLAIYTNQRGR